MTENYQQLLQATLPAAVRRHAREQMGQTRPSFWMVALVVLVLTSLIPDAVTGLRPAVTASGDLNGPGLFLTILMTLFTWVIAFGFKWWALDCSDGLRGEDAPSIHTLFNGFSMVTGVLLLELDLAARMVLWSLVVSVPVSLLMGMMFFWSGSVSTVFFLTLLLSIGACYVINLRYALARYLYIDQPEEARSVRQAIRDSVALMRGWKGRLFQLQLSFVGWYLLEVALMVLAIVLVGFAGLVELSSVWATVRGGGILAAVGMVLAVPAAELAVTLLPLPLDLWLTPYTNVAAARFYQLRTQLAQCPPPVYEHGENGWDGPEQ